MTNEQKALKAIAREMESIPGHLGFYYKNLTTGDTFGIREEEAFLAASVIKLPLLPACAATERRREDRSK